MARLRNKTDDTLQTRLGSVSVGVTEPDALLDIPDDVYLAHAWPASLWDEVDVPRRPDPENAPDPAEGTVDDVKARVGEDAALAQAALDAENAKSEPRKSLVAHLDQIIKGS